MTSTSTHRVRRRLRLKGHDYSQAGAYFVTLCTRNRICLFGELDGEAMRLSETGRVVASCWQEIPRHFAISLDEWIVMPNHLHGIVVIPDNGTSLATLGLVIGTFKSAATKRVNEIRRTRGAPLWQRSFHEHVIRDEADLKRIRQYIVNNPIRWAQDPENPNPSLD